MSLAAPGLVTSNRWLHRAIIGGSATAVALLLAGCSTGTPARSAGDPGNQRLHQLRADPIFTVIPPGAQLIKPIAESPAQYRAPGLDGGGQDGPAVIATLTSSQPPASVFAFYAQRTVTTGWTPTGSQNVLGYPQVWKKTYTGNLLASLALRGDINTAQGPIHTYTLVAALPSKVIR